MARLRLLTSVTALVALVVPAGCGGPEADAAPIPPTVASSAAPAASPPSTAPTATTRPRRDRAQTGTRTPVSRPPTTAGGGSQPPGTGPGSSRRGGRRTTTTTVAAALPVSEAMITLPDFPQRPARLHVPARPAGTKVPLLIALHGSYSDADRLAAYTELDAIAEAAGWAVLWPQGEPVGGIRSWNAGSCCEPASVDGVDDMDYLGALLDDVLATDPIDPARVAVAGHSNGAFMAYTFACRATERVMAVVAVSGGLATGCTPARALPVLAIHGTGDESVQYSLGAASARHWKDADACTTESSTSQGEVRDESWNGCEDGVSVRLITLSGAPHAWPGGPAPTVDGFDAGEALVAWLNTLPARTA